MTQGVILGFLYEIVRCVLLAVNGTLSVEKVNSTTDRKCFFRRELLDDKLMRQN